MIRLGPPAAQGRRAWLDPRMATETLDAAVAALTQLQLVPEGVDAVERRDAARYLRELARMPLAGMEQQPAHQTATAASLEQQRTELCLRQTGVFVDAYCAESAVPATLEKLDAVLRTLGESAAPSVLDAAARFERTAGPTLAYRSALLQLESVHDASLRRMLQLPALLHTCVDAGHYDDALRLVEHFVRVTPVERGAKGGAVPDGDAAAQPILVGLRAEVGGALLHLYTQLLAALGAADLKLPQARRRIDQLLRMAALGRHAFPGSAFGLGTWEVCYAFLQARFRWVAAALGEVTSVSTSERHTRVNQALDAWKDVVLGTASTVLSVFLERGGSGGGGGDDAPVCTRLLATFALRAAERLGAFLVDQLPLFALGSDGQPAALEDAGRALAHTSTQLHYASARLAHVGLTLDLLHPDGVEVPVVEAAALTLWRHALQAAEQRTAAALAQGLRETAIPDEVQAPAPGDVHATPRALAAFPACLEASRGVVCALNAYRQYAPLRMRTAALEALRASLARIGEQMRDTRGEPAAVQRLATCYERELQPWAEAALLTGVYNEAPRAQT